MSNVMLSMDTRRQLLRVLKTRYQAASKAEKTRILEEFILISGYHRKSAIRLLNGAITNSSQQSLSHGSFDLWRRRSTSSDCPLGSLRSLMRQASQSVTAPAYSSYGETWAYQSESGTPRATDENQCVLHRSPAERSTYHRR